MTRTLTALAAARTWARRHRTDLIFGILGILIALAAVTVVVVVNP